MSVGRRRAPPPARDYFKVKLAQHLKSANPYPAEDPGPISLTVAILAQESCFSAHRRCNAPQGGLYKANLSLSVTMARRVLALLLLHLLFISVTHCKQQVMQKAMRTKVDITRTVMQKVIISSSSTSSSSASHTANSR